MLKYGTYKDGYQGIATKGNQLLAELLNDMPGDYNLITTTDRFNPCDTIISSTTRQTGCEVKVREREYPTLLLEEYKWQTSPQSAKESGCTSWCYANFISDNLCYIYTENAIKNEIDNGAERTTIYARKDTPEQNDGKTYVPSILLPISAATKFEKVEGKWEISKPF